MYMFLPDETSHINLLLKNMTDKNWQKWLSSFKVQEVVAVLPTMNHDSDLDFSEVLQDLGMKRAFRKGAEFDKLCNGGPFINEVKQKIFFNMNEEGTEAAAVDKVVFKKGGCPHIYFTRPFVYALVDSRTQAILLMGVYQQ